MKKLELTMLIEKGDSGLYIGQVQEYPAALSQGKTIDELKKNLRDAVNLLLDEEKKELEKNRKSKVIKRRLTIAR